MQHTPFDATRKSKQSHDRTLQAISQRHKLGGIVELADRQDPIWFGAARTGTLRVFIRRLPANAFQGAEPDPLGGGVGFDAPFQEQPI